MDEGAVDTFATTGLLFVDGFDTAALAACFRSEADVLIFAVVFDVEECFCF